MSRNRGGRGAGNSNLRRVANALGIARHEISAFSKVITDAQQTYSPLPRTILPLDMTDEMHYMAELRQELLARFHESSFHLESREKDFEFRRYTDKYREIEKEEFQPDFPRLPDELCWQRKKKTVGEPTAKKMRLLENTAKDLSEKLSILEKKDNANQEIESAETVQSDEEGSEKEEKNENDDQEPFSDDDYQEEDNDYIHSYFDNGENYGDAGSDDNLDEDNPY